MPSFSELRQKFPQYSDMNDVDFATAFHQKYYPDMSYEDFGKAVGLTPEPIARQIPKEYGMGLTEGLVGTGEAVSPTKVGPEPSIRGKSKEELGSYELPKAKSAVEELNFPPAQSGVGRYARAAGQTTPSGVLAPGGIPGALFYGPGSGIMGEAVGDLTSKIPFVGEQAAPSAKMMATIFGPGFFAKRVAPFRQTDPLVNQAAGVLNRYGINPTVGQRFGNKAQQAREFADNPAINRQQGEALTRAYTGGIGPGGATNRLTKSTQGNFFRVHGDRIRNDFDNLAANTFADPTIQQGAGSFNSHAYNRLVDVATNADRENPDHINSVLSTIQQINPRWVPNARGVASGAIQPSERLADALFRVAPGPVATPTITGMTGTRTMTGLEYQRLRTGLHSAAETPGMAPERAQIYRHVADALDDAMETTLRNRGSPLAGRWQQSRSQYRHLLTLEDAASRMGPGETMLTPDKMAAAEKAIYSTRPYLRGETPYAGLTESAGLALKPLEQGEGKQSLIARTANKVPGGRFVYNNFPPLVYGATTAALHKAGYPIAHAMSYGIGPLLASEWFRRNRDVPRLPPTIGSNPVSQRMAVSPVFTPEGKGQRQLSAFARALMQLNQQSPDQP